MKNLCRSLGVTIIVASMIVVCTVQRATAQSFNFCTDCAGTSGSCAIPAIATNPDIAAVCPNVDIVFVLDESGSISGFQGDVKNGVMAFLNALNGTGMNIAIIEFNALARTVTNYSVVNTALINNVQGYFDGIPFNGQTYAPADGTNWQSAMNQVLSLATPELILFFTDGNPTGWTNNGNVDYCSDGSTTQQPEIVNPMLISNYFKTPTRNTHMFMLGVGSVNVTNLERMSGTDNWTTGESIVSTDYVLESSFSNLANGLREFAIQLCGTPITVTKILSTNPICAGGTATYTLTVTNTGATHSALDLILRDTFPATLSIPACQTNCTNVCIGTVCNPVEPIKTLVWTVGNLAPGASASIVVSATAAAAGSIINRARVTGTNVNPVMATNTLTVLADPTVSIVVDDNTICDGGSPTFTATVTGGTGPNIFQWQYDPPGTPATWGIVGTNINPYITPPLAANASTHNYRVQLSQSSGCSANSNELGVTVVADPVVNITNPLPNFCVGGSTTLTAAANGGQGATYTYQWQQLISAVWTNVGTNITTYATGVINTPGTYTYRVIVSQPSLSCTTASANSVVTVAADPTVNITSPANTLCVGGTNVITANITGGVGCTYTWQKLISSTWTNVQTGGTTYTIPTNLALGTHQYRFIISACQASCGAQVVSNTKVITVIAGPTISLEGGNPNICIGGTVSFLATVSGGLGCQVRFEYRPGTSGTWTTVSTGNTIYVTSPTLGLGTHQIRAVYGNCDNTSGCGDVFSAPITFTIHPDPTITMFASAPELCSNGVNTMTTSVTGGYGINQFQWQVNPANTGWQNISGAIFSSYIASSPPGTYQYRVLLSQNLGCSAMSNTVNITINQAPSVSIITPGNPYCNGETIVIDATGTNGAGVITSYNWTGPNGFTANTQDLTIPTGASYPGPGNHQYCVTVTDNGGCTAYSCIVVEVEINPVVIASATFFSGAPNPYSELDGQDDAMQPQILYPVKDKDGENDGANIHPKHERDTFQLFGNRSSVAFPCSCAHRWAAGSHWNEDGTINDLSNNPPAHGIVACGSSASTENQLQNVDCDYNSSLFNIILGADCFNPATQGRTNIVNPPVNGQDIVWFNFDIRPFAGSFQYQILPGGNSLGWALFYTGDPESGVHMGPGVDSLSGNCNNIYYYDCGISDQGWVTYTVPSFAEPSNYYLAIWSNNNQDFSSQNVTFKGRFGCGDADVILCLIEEVGTTTTCNTNGTYSVVTQVQGINGTYVGVDNTNTPGVTFNYAPNPLTLTNLGSANPVITGTLTANYPNGVPYNFTIYEDTGAPNNSSGNNDANNYCTLTISGAAPNCCLLDIVSLSVVPETCPGAANGRIVVNITGVVLAEYSLNGTNYQSSNVFTGLSTGLYNVYVRIPGNPFCNDFFPNAFVPVLSCPTTINICETQHLQLLATGYPGTGLITNYSWSGPLGFTSTLEDPTILNTSPKYPGVGTHIYIVTVTDANGCSGTGQVTVIIHDAPSSSLTVLDSTICVGTSTILTATVSGGENCSIVWQRFNAGAWQTVQSGGSTYNVPSNLPVGSYPYRVLYTNCSNTACPIAVSNTINIQVLQLGNISISASIPNLCEGGNTVLTASITGGAGCTLIWQRRTGTSGAFTNIVGANNINPFTTGAALPVGTHQFRAYFGNCSIGSECGNDTSNIVTITIVVDPIFQTDLVGFSECIGQTQSLSVIPTGGTGTFSYLWQSGTSASGPWGNVGGNNSSFTPPSGTAGTYFYRVLVSSTGAGCNQLISATATVVIAQQPNVVISTTNTIICQGGASVITSVVTLGSGTYTYQWQRSPQGLNTWTSITSAGTGASYNVPSGTTGSFDYRLLVFDVVFDCGDPVSNVVNISVQSQPEVSSSTNDGTICVGATALLTSTVTGGSGTFSYQWQSSTSSSGPWTNISGATGATYNAPGTSVGIRWYQVIVTDVANNCQDPISNAISVTVIAQPTISVNTTTPVICIDGEFTINSTVNGGSGLYLYQWQSSSSPSGPWTNIVSNGSFSSYSAVLSVQGTYYYRIIADDLANGCGNMISTAISIIVNPNPTVVVTPPAQTVCVGGTALLTATVTNGSGNYSYQWEFSPDGSSWNNVASGGNASTYSAPTGATGSIYYRVLLTDNGNGCSNPYSEFVYVIVNAQPVVTINVNNPVICIGGSATITSLVNNGSGTFTYQWQQSNNGSTGWGNVPANGNGSSYNVPSATAGVIWYRLLVFDPASGCADPLSNVLNVTIRSLATVTIDPNEDVICQGGSTVIISTILNGSGFYTYQWQSSPTGGAGTWANISSAGTGPNYNVPSGSPSTTYYRLIVSDAGSGCGSSLSNAVPVIIETQPIVSLAVDNSVICIGGVSHITATVLDGSGTFNFQWQSSPNGSTGWSNVGFNLATYTINGIVAGTTYYRVIVTDPGSGCLDPVSETTSVIVQSGPSVNITADNDSVCVFGPVEITPIVINGSGLYLYQWQSSPTGAAGTWSSIGGATQPSYAPPTGTPGVTWYRIVVTDLGNGCGDPASPGIRIRVFAQPTVSITIDTPVICIGGVGIIVSTITNGSGIFTYQWQVSDNGSVWTNITTNGNSPNYTVPSGSASTKYYRLLLTDNSLSCEDPESNAIGVDVVAPAFVTINAQDDTVCLGAVTIINATVTGGSGYFTYQWQRSPNGTNSWTNVSANGNTASYTVPTSLAGTTYYRLVLIDLANGCQDPVPVPVRMVVQSQPIVSINAANPVICINGSSIITSTITGGSGTITYHWQSSPNGANTWTNIITGGSGATYTVPTNVVGTFYYRLHLSDDANGCADPTSSVVTIQVVLQPAVTIAANNLILCVGGSSTITSTITNGSGFYLYQWQSSPNGSSWTNITVVGNGPNYSVPTASPSSSYYRLLLTDVSNGCNDPVSNQVQVIVQPQPTVSITVNNPLVCIGGSSLLTSVVVDGSSNVTYQWQTSPTGTGSWTSIAVNGTSATYSPPNSSAGTTYYRVLINDAGNGCTDPVSNTEQIIVQSQPTVTIATANPNICIDGLSIITSTVINGSQLLAYQWQLSSSGTSGWDNININGNNSSYEVPSSVAGSYFYRVLVTDLSSGCNDPISNVVNIIISADLSVLTPPVDITECIGGTDQFTIIVAGGSGTVTYQWQSSTSGSAPWFNATGTGANSASFTPPSTVAGTTYYRVLVNAGNNGCGQLESSIVYATITPDLLVTTQPTPVTECIGGTNQMTVTVTGGVGTISYQWQASPNGSSGWANATGTGSTTNLFTPPSTVAGTTHYRAIISAPGGGCGAAISNVVTAIISADITFTTQAININECVGGTSQMSVVITGGSGTVTYQWQSSPNGTDTWSNATGTSTNATYTPNSTVTGTTYYRVLVNAINSGCDQAISTTASAIINPDLNFTTQPIGFNECEGGTNQLTVVIAGGVGTISYLWQSSLNGTSGWANASGTGSTTASYTPPSTNPGTTYYRVIVAATGNGCGSATSTVVLVEIDQDATVTVAPVLNEVCVNGAATLTATVTGGSNSLSVQWQVNNSGWSDISGATALTYAPPTATTGTIQYRVRIIDINSGCATPFSNIVSVIVTVSATVSAAVNNAEVCIDGTALLTATITGGSSGLTRQWQSSPNGSAWTNIAGATATTYSAPTSVAGTFFYRIIITDPNASCADPVSNQVIVIVVPDPVVNVTPASTEICIGGSALLTANIVGGSSAQALQWQSFNGTVWVNIAGANSSTYSITGTVAGTTQYRILVTDSNSGCPASITSVPVNVIIQPDAIVNVTPLAAEVCLNGEALLTATVTGGSSQLTYQWQTSSSGQNAWTNIVGATGVSYSAPTGVVGVIDYRIVITDLLPDCSDPASAAVPVTVVPDASISVAPLLTEVCVGGNANLTATITGGSSALMIQWQTSPNGSAWSNIAGATLANYSAPTGATGTIFYRALVIDNLSGCEDPISNNGQVTVSPDLVVSAQPIGFTECVGGNSTMTVSVTGGSGVLSYQWQSSPNGSAPWANASGTGATSILYTPLSITAGTTHYRVLINAANSGCDQAVSVTAIVIITPDLTVSTQPTPVTECIGGTATMSVSISGGTGTFGYQWQSSPNGLAGWANATGTGSTTSLFTPPSTVAGTTWYRVIVNASGIGCDNTLSDTARAVIIPDLSVSTQPISIAECVGGSATMTVAVTGGVGTLSYQWQASADGSTGWSNATGTGSTTVIYT
ncbi:MAG: VWA domain-containing protein, partial [Bacteroidota bacterium]|nr:VWA domain-containing protein [Bacteroidota bacterium]